jgi:hypothetical protein
LSKLFFRHRAWQKTFSGAPLLLPIPTAVTPALS